MSSKNVPNEKWSLQRLGDFCVARRNRLADDAWWIGKAILLAKAKTKHGEFGEWKKTHGFSDAIASRYMRLATKHESPEKIEGRKITEVLFEEGILPPGKAKKRTALKEPIGFPSWAVLGPDDEFVPEIVETDADDGVATIPIPTLAKKLQYDLVLLPNQVTGLSATIRAILKHPKKEREAAWPVERVAVIKTAVQELRAALAELEEEMSEGIEAVGRKLSA